MVGGIGLFASARDGTTGRAETGDAVRCVGPIIAEGRAGAGRGSTSADERAPGAAGRAAGAPARGGDTWDDHGAGEIGVDVEARLGGGAIWGEVGGETRPSEEAGKCEAE